MKVFSSKELKGTFNTDKLSNVFKMLSNSEDARTVFEKVINIPLPSKILLHGSPQLIQELSPHISDGGSNENKGEELIYATSDFNYAVFLAVIDLKDSGRASVISDEKETFLNINKQFVNGGSQIVRGYLHVLDGTAFSEHNNHEFTSGKAVKPVCAIEVGIEDLEYTIAIRES